MRVARTRPVARPPLSALAEVRRGEGARQPEGCGEAGGKLDEARGDGRAEVAVRGGVEAVGDLSAQGRARLGEITASSSRPRSRNRSRAAAHCCADRSRVRMNNADVGAVPVAREIRLDLPELVRQPLLLRPGIYIAESCRPISDKDD
ncbi:hypothetical protein GCM10023191_036800 [Actinoallomurus oryzae]|uniref:Uncharacterized protein n=1 Tax=Actinoallomurus oryzae TaxID=502180 RepID=A0ABP8PZP9_9ACTN